MRVAGETHVLRAIHAFKLYLIFVSILLVGSFIIALIMEDLLGYERLIVLVCITGWAFLSYGLMVILEDYL